MGVKPLPLKHRRMLKKIFACAGRHTLPPFGAALYRIS